MFSDPQFWVAVSFFLFLIAIFNPVRKILTSNLDTQINEIKSKIHEAEDLKKEAEKTLTDLKNRQSDVEKEILEFMSGLDIIIHEVYGQSEDTGPTTFNRPLPGQRKLGTVGLPFPGVDVRIADDGSRTNQ
mgnify:CR=1 FL=1